MEDLARASANPDEIKLGDSDEESEEGEGEGVEEVPIEGQVIPSAVFGSIPEEKQGEVLGAKERFNKKKKRQRLEYELHEPVLILLLFCKIQLMTIADVMYNVYYIMYAHMLNGYRYVIRGFPW